MPHNNPTENTHSSYKNCLSSSLLLGDYCLNYSERRAPKRLLDNLLLGALLEEQHHHRDVILALLLIDDVPHRLLADGLQDLLKWKQIDGPLLEQRTGI